MPYQKSEKRGPISPNPTDKATSHNGGSHWFAPLPRRGFWLRMTVVTVLFFADLTCLFGQPESDGPLITTPTLLTYGTSLLLLCLYATCLSVRRLHDAGYSGWWVLIWYAPFGYFILPYLLCKPTKPRKENTDVPGSTTLNNIVKYIRRNAKGLTKLLVFLGILLVVVIRCCLEPDEDKCAFTPATTYDYALEIHSDSAFLGDSLQAYRALDQHYARIARRCTYCPASFVTDLHTYIEQHNLCALVVLLRHCRYAYTLSEVYESRYKSSLFDDLLRLTVPRRRHDTVATPYQLTYILSLLHYKCLPYDHLISHMNLVNALNSTQPDSIDAALRHHLSAPYNAIYTYGNYLYLTDRLCEVYEFRGGRASGSHPETLLEAVLNCPAYSDVWDYWGSADDVPSTSELISSISEEAHYLLKATKEERDQKRKVREKQEAAIALREEEIRHLLEFIVSRIAEDARANGVPQAAVLEWQTIAENDIKALISIRRRDYRWQSYLAFDKYIKAHK